MHLYLIRHGQSTNNHLYAATGAEVGRAFDPELTETGRKQAECLSAYLATFASGRDPLLAPITHLFTSPMLRAIDTGLPAARRLGLALTAWKDLHEGGGLFLEDEDTGELVGQPGPDRATIAARFPELGWPAEMGDGPWWNRPAELPEERLLRARRVLGALLAQHPPESEDGVVFFTHANFSNYMLAAALATPGEQRPPAWFALHNTAICRIEFRPGGDPVIVFWNRTEHLPPELITG
jgi:2,3-bisphosphoglycerate-dependent phosphoglycerate mutase